MFSRRFEEDGVVAGHLGRYGFMARLTRGPVSYGLNRSTLYKGRGRIAQLRIWRFDHSGEVEILALYDKGWQYGRLQHLRVVRRLVDTLDGR
ncbi:MAG: hypothetical protein M0Z66_02760 [Thermaerobacter sp.]|nr:hypothetical protein [Thermaerobacter sp.]